LPAYAFKLMIFLSQAAQVIGPTGFLVNIASSASLSGDSFFLSVLTILYSSLIFSSIRPIFLEVGYFGANISVRDSSISVILSMKVFSKLSSSSLDASFVIFA